MIADSKLTGTVDQGFGVAKYMIDPYAKADNNFAQELQSQDLSERVLMIRTLNAFPVLNFIDPKDAAERFLADIERWNCRHRPGKPPPKSAWEHRVISFHPEDSKKITPESACKIAQESLLKIAPGTRPTLLVVHGDTAHLHVHLMYSTVNERGIIHNPHQDFRKWESVMEEMEVKYSLFRVNKRIACADINPDRFPNRTNPSKHEFRMIQRTGEQSCKQKLRCLIDEAIGSIREVPEPEKFIKFIALLRSKKVGISANIQSTGNVLGLRLYYGIFSQHGIKSSALGNQYAWGNLSSSTDFQNNSLCNSHYLRLIDHRVAIWSNNESGGKKCANTAIKSNICIKQSNSDLVTPNKKLAVSSNQSVPGMTSPEFPVDYPEWLKQYIRAIVNAANAELMRQQQANNQLNHSIESILQLLFGIQKRGINNFMKRKLPNTVIKDRGYYI